MDYVKQHHSGINAISLISLFVLRDRTSISLIKQAITNHQRLMSNLVFNIQLGLSLYNFWKILLTLCHFKVENTRHNFSFVARYSLLNSLVTRCSLQKFTRYSLQKLLVLKYHSLLVTKCDRCILHKITMYSQFYLNLVMNGKISLNLNLFNALHKQKPCVTTSQKFFNFG